jgi:hypothetical protein
MDDTDDTDFETIHPFSQEASSSDNEELPPAKRRRGMAREWQKQRNFADEKAADDFVSKVSTL